MVSACMIFQHVEVMYERHDQHPHGKIIVIVSSSIFSHMGIAIAALAMRGRTLTWGWKRTSLSTRSRLISITGNRPFFAITAGVT